MKVSNRLLSILLVLTLAGCGSSGRAPVEDRRGNSAVKVYQVQRGDTLYSIAFRYGLDYRKVAEVNNISDPYIIYPGQHLYLWQVASSPFIVSGPPQTPAPVVSDNPGLPAAYTPSPVIVTAVPGIAAPPVSQVAMPPSPVYQGGNPGAGSDAASGAPYAPSPSQSAPVTGATVAGVSSVAAPATATSAPPVVATAPVAAPRPTAAPGPSRAPTPGARVTSWRWPSSGSVTRRYSSSVHKGIDIGGNRGDPVYAVADGTVVYAGTGIVGFGELIILKHNDIYISAYGHNSRLLVREGDVVGVGQIIAEKGSTGTDTVKLHFEIRKEGKPIDPLKLLPRR
jgi:lipoprotein NlpD